MLEHNEDVHEYTQLHIVKDLVIFFLQSFNVYVNGCRRRFTFHLKTKADVDNKLSKNVDRFEFDVIRNYSCKPTQHYK